MGLEKLGLHITNGTRLPLVGPHGRPRIVKLHECSVAYKRQVREEVGPDCLIVVRWFESRQDLAVPEREAEEWFRRHEADMRAMAAGDPNVVVEGYNEIPDDMAPAFARFELRRLQLMHAAGLRAGVLSSSVGTPDWPVWAIYRPLLEAMGPGDVVCLHEYWAESADLGRDWYCGRFAHERVRPYLAGKAVAITECGRDVLIEGDVVRGARGWQRTTDGETFLGELRTYNAILEAHPNVIGATVYDDGHPDPQWHPYSPAPIWGRVVAEYTESTPAKPPAEEVPVATLLPMDGRLMDLEAFRQHLETVDLSWVRRVVMHHTAKPDEAAWAKWGGWEYWKLSLRSYYSGLGWLAMPHLFAGPDGIGLLWSLGGPGRGVGGGALEAGCLHIETVGRYTDHLPEGAILDNAVGAAAALLNAAGLGMEALTHHTAVVGPGVTDCPGAAWRAAWGWFAGLVAAARIEQELPPAEPLPQDEPDGPAAWLMDKVRWWTEELARALQGGREERAQAILDGLISLEYGLMYRLERRLKG